MDFPKWITEDEEQVYYRAAREEFGRVVPVEVEGRTEYAYRTVTGGEGSNKDQDAAKRSVEFAYRDTYTRAVADREIGTAEAGKGADK